jgi:hypothetical protein
METITTGIEALLGTDRPGTAPHRRKDHRQGTDHPGRRDHLVRKGHPALPRRAGQPRPRAAARAQDLFQPEFPYRAHQRLCVFTCNFCSYSRVYAHRDEGWELTPAADARHREKLRRQAGDRSAYRGRRASKDEPGVLPGNLARRSRPTGPVCTSKGSRRWSSTICSARQNFPWKKA